MENLQHIPRAGEEVEIGGYTLRTLEVESHRVQKVLIIPPVEPEDGLNYEV
jgi:CBS domain containing-hemolysin-like protein